MAGGDVGSLEAKLGSECCFVTRDFVTTRSCKMLLERIHGTAQAEPRSLRARGLEYSVTKVREYDTGELNV